MSQDLLGLINVLGPVVVAIIFGAITAFIAWRQYRVARSKLNLDLFERRYKIVRRVWAICVDSVSEQTVLLDKKYRGSKTPFDSIWPQAQFMLGSDVNDFIEQLTMNWLELSSIEHHVRQDSSMLESRERRKLYYWF